MNSELLNSAELGSDTYHKLHDALSICLQLITLNFDCALLKRALVGQHMEKDSNMTTIPSHPSQHQKQTRTVFMTMLIDIHHENGAGYTNTMTFLDNTLGAAFIGHTAAAVLYGITSLQTFIYFKFHYGDALVLRLLVCVVWILDTLHVGLITSGMYRYLITDYGDILSAAVPIWEILVMVMVSNVSNAIIRGVVVYRLWKLSKQQVLQWFFCIAITLLSFYVFAAGIFFAVEGFFVDSYEDVSGISWSLYSGFAVEVALDALIVTAQCLTLKQYRTGVTRVDRVINTLMTYMINTGLLTSICALLCLITFITLPGRYVYFAFYFVLSKFYVNALLATLNSRGALRQLMESKQVLVDCKSRPTNHENAAPSSMDSVFSQDVLTIEFNHTNEASAASAEQQV
ncbi:hypothetical protein ABKN59_008914 [Abortiporus biennis]